MEMVENSFRFFNNKDCKYMPCHHDIDAENINCMFCYCPMNQYDDCLGNPRYIDKNDGRRVKDCSSCCFPHVPENYDAVIDFLKKKSGRNNET